MKQEQLFENGTWKSRAWELNIWKYSAIDFLFLFSLLMMWINAETHQIDPIQNLVTVFWWVFV